MWKSIFISYSSFLQQISHSVDCSYCSHHVMNTPDSLSCTDSAAHTLFLLSICDCWFIYDLNNCHIQWQASKTSPSEQLWQPAIYSGGKWVSISTVYVGAVGLRVILEPNYLKLPSSNGFFPLMLSQLTVEYSVIVYQWEDGASDENFNLLPE